MGGGAETLKEVIYKNWEEFTLKAHQCEAELLEEMELLEDYLALNEPGHAFHQGTCELALLMAHKSRQQEHQLPEPLLTSVPTD